MNNNRLNSYNAEDLESKYTNNTHDCRKISNDDNFTNNLNFTGIYR